jgi:hypothetical protein
MWRSVYTGVLCGVVVMQVGCGPSPGERKNDAGPPIEIVPGGPPPMRPPGQGDLVPPGPTKTPKKR